MGAFDRTAASVGAILSVLNPQAPTSRQDSPDRRRLRSNAKSGSAIYCPVGGTYHQAFRGNMKKTLILLSLFILASLSDPAMAVEVTNYNGTFVRGSGATLTETITFPGVEGVAVLRLSNAAEDDSMEKVSSSIIKINGIDIFSQDDFNRNFSYLEREIQLIEGQNSISVEVRGKPGGAITIDIVQSVKANAAAIIGTDGGTIEVLDQESLMYGVKVEIPQGAVSSETLITISDGTDTNDPQSDTPDISDAFFRIDLGPSGTKFNKPVIISIQYIDLDSDGIVDGTTFDEEKIYAFISNDQLATRMGIFKNYLQRFG
jgi:hypothetical protein